MSEVEIRLSKDVCTQCWMTNYPDPDGLLQRDVEQWFEDSGALLMLCPFGKMQFSKYENPPAGCPYTLEHAVALGMDGEKRS